MKNKILIIFCLMFLSAKSAAQTYPFIGQIAYVAFTFPPKGWAECNGQILSIQQNQALFSLLGTTYGGNGTSTFALPNIQGRVMVGEGTGAQLPTYINGQIGGTETSTLTINQIPAHTHILAATTAEGNSSAPSSTIPANTKTLDKEYSTTLNNSVAMSPAMTSAAGGDQPHPNIQPYVTFKCIIALQGIFPPRP